MSSLLADLHEMRDYMVKIDAWGKRINARLLRLGEQNENPSETGRGGSRSKSAPPADAPREVRKAYLRELAGIIPGKYPRHEE